MAVERSFRRAGARLGYSRSGISRQIASLEQVTGQRLVQRSPGGAEVELTPAGVLVADTGRVILARVRAVEADLAAEADQHADELRVGTMQSITVRVLPNVLHLYARAWPHVQIQPVEMVDDLRLYEAVEQGDLDVAFVELPAPEGPFEAVELFADRYLLVLPRDDQESQPVESSLAQLAAFPLLAYRDGRGQRRLEAELRARGILRAVSSRFDTDATLQAMVAAGLGAAVMPALAVDTADPRVEIHELSEIPPRKLAIVRNIHREQSLAVKAFLQAARRVCAGTTRPEAT